MAAPALASGGKGAPPPPQPQPPAGGRCGRAAWVASLLLCLSLGALQLWQLCQTAELRGQLQRQQRRLTALEQEVTNVLLASAAGPATRQRRSVSSAAQSVSPAGIPIVDRPYGYRPGLHSKQAGLRFYDSFGTVTPRVDNPTILPHHRSSAAFAGRQLGRVNSDPAPTAAEPPPAAAPHHHGRSRTKQAAAKAKKTRRGRRRRLPRKRVHVKRAEAKRMGVKRMKMPATKSRPAAEARGAPVSFTSGPSSISGDHRRTAGTGAAGDHHRSDLLGAASRRRLSAGTASLPAGGGGPSGQRRPAAGSAGSGGGHRRGRRLMRMMEELRQELGTTVAHLEGHTTEYSLDHPHYDGNGVLRNVQPNARFADWRFAPWVHRLGYSKDFLLSGGQVTVKRPGVYYLYAQINYLDPSDINGFEMMVSGQSFAKCLTMESTDHEQKVNTCHTSGVTYLETGDTVSIRDLEWRRISMFLPDRSFFGLVRLAGTGGTSSSRRQRRSHDDKDN